MEALQTLNQYSPAPIRPIKTKELPKDGLFVSEEEYWEKYYIYPDHNYEWNNGYLEEKPVTDYEGFLAYDWFIALLRSYLETNPVAKTMGLEMGFRLALPHKTTIRKPDLAVILHNNKVPLKRDDCTFKGVCDIAIESLSHKDKKAEERDTVTKKEEYKLIGVREYYILDARQKKTAFYKRNQHGHYEHIRPIQDDIIRSEVLSGFQFRISDLYKQPSLLSLTEYPIYQKFIMPYYQQERILRKEAVKLAEHERRRAEKERKLREQATERAEFLANKLRKLGISAED